MGKLAEIVYSCAADKQHTIVLSSVTDDGNQLIAEAIHDFSAWADKPFFVLACSGQTGRNARIVVTHPLNGELPDLFTGNPVLASLQGGTVLLSDPYNIPVHQQQDLLSLLSTELSMKVLIHTKSYHRDTPGLSMPLLNDAQMVKVPALRGQSEDIRFAANYFLSKSNIEWHKNVPGITEECMAQLLVYPWPGQLPQLRDAIRQAAFLAPNNEVLTLSSLPPQIRTFKATDRDFLKEAVKQAEYEMIYKTLRETNNNKRKTAEILKISRKTLYSKINMYKMDSYAHAPNS